MSKACWRAPPARSRPVLSSRSSSRRGAAAPPPSRLSRPESSPPRSAKRAEAGPCCSPSSTRRRHGLRPARRSSSPSRGASRFAMANAGNGSRPAHASFSSRGTTSRPPRTVRPRSSFSTARSTRCARTRCFSSPASPAWPVAPTEQQIAMEYGWVNLNTAQRGGRVTTPRAEALRRPRVRRRRFVRQGVVDRAVLGLSRFARGFLERRAQAHRR